MGKASDAPRRVDAERNREKILEAARAAFAGDGSEPSMAEIARRAGVGMATLYRHFPGRLELVEELYRAQVDAICDSVRSVAGDTAGDRLIDWLHRFQAAGAQKGALASLLMREESSAVFSESRQRVLAAAEPLLRAAQESGEVRSDVTIGGIADAVVALGRLDRGSPSDGPMVDVLLDGLRTRSR